ncbi:PREDICTED: ropporin-1-like protein isoform X2 [Myotis davidii]|uniref:ropporin-1-like protein isoform X2 n=1 Tax=Myotis davidii TaxID=225400 RepID=UPI000767199D|nr:PREDICTED: ropporin-1-like protein isoform X2 [Myotis davidii]
MYINLLNLVVTLFWTCCDLDRKRATEPQCRSETNDVSGAQCHGVPSSFYEVNCTFCLSWLLKPYQERKRKQKSAVEFLCTPRSSQPDPGLGRAMPLPDTLFCAQQIHIPPELPDILKQFTKAAIRTQPADVLQWAAGYFSALSRGDPLPVKDRIEMPVATQKTDTGLTQGMLKVLHKQCSPNQYVELVDLEQKWRSLCLPMEKFRALLQLDPCEYRIEWIKFLALGCSMLGGRRHLPAPRWAPALGGGTSFLLPLVSDVKGKSSVAPCLRRVSS